jgi:glycosyltransferase involved in cell wall biosynthesis
VDEGARTIGAARAAASGESRLMRILVATDAWHPQVNGVVRTLTMMADAARELGVDVRFLTPESFRTFALPSYPDLRVACPAPAQIEAQIREASADNVHIATEGPIGFLVRRYCRKHDIAFTTSFHTRFAEYISARYPIPESWIWKALRRFHGASSAVMAATPALAAELRLRGFSNVVLWPRGVDAELFRPRESDLDLPRPVFLSVGRVAVEKNLQAFLTLDLPGTKVVVGEGPARATLQKQYPEAVFLGARHGEALAEAYAAADVFVFPSRTDTFGLVLLEALASGVPVAAFPVSGPRDVIGDVPVGSLNEDLGLACLTAMKLSKAACRDFALEQTWNASARAFIDNVMRVRLQHHATNQERLAMPGPHYAA